MATYEPPEWGVDGANAFGISIEVIKSGIVVERLALPIDLRKSCVVAGRMEPVCDLVLQHPSISRVHAALQFDAHGALFLRDLQSTHGTFVNKQRVTPNEFVRLHIGDVVVFGESTRLYALCGPTELLPAEYESENLQRLRAKSEQRQEKKALQRQSARNRKDKGDNDTDSGASWGFREDAADDDDDDDVSDDDNDKSSASSKDKLPDYLRNLKEDETAYASSLKASDVSEKDQKLFQQLQARIKKMENLKLEKSRIEAKQHQLTGLTDGQQQTLARNEQRIDALRKEIEDIEDRIHAKNAQRAKTKADSATSAAAGTKGRNRNKASATDALYSYGSDEDDFYDRTTTNQRKHLARKQQLGVAGDSAAAVGVSSSSDVTAVTTADTNSSSGSIKAQTRTGALTAESIEKQIAALERELREVVHESETALALAHRDAGSSSDQKRDDNHDDGADDSLDAFMASTTRELHATQLAALQSRRATLDTELRRQRQLLVLATPALARVSAAAARESEPPQSEPQSQTQSQSPVVSAPSAVTAETMDNKPAALMPVAAPIESTLAAPKRSADPLDASASADVLAPTASSTVSATSALPVSEPSVCADTALPPKKRRVVGPTRPPPTAAKSSNSSAVAADPRTLEGGDSVWVPPPNQTGDGRTALNDKFGY